MRFLFPHHFTTIRTNTHTHTHTHTNTQQSNFNNSSPSVSVASRRITLYKGRFATFVRSYWNPQKITHKYVKPVTSKLHVLNSACFPLITIHNKSIGTVTPCNTGM